MAKNCVNIKSKEFKDLENNAVEKGLLLASSIMSWQTRSNSETYPSLQELGSMLKLRIKKDGTTAMVSPNKVGKVRAELKRLNSKYGFSHQLNNHKIEGDSQNLKFTANFKLATKDKDKKHFSNFISKNVDTKSFTPKELLKDKEETLQELNIEEARGIQVEDSKRTGEDYIDDYEPSPQMSNEGKLRIEELDGLLTTWAARNGISVEAYVNLKDKLGVDAAGAADIMNKLIYVANDKADRTTLPEEIGHFGIAMVKDEGLTTRLMELAKQTTTYKEVVDEYGVMYDHNEHKLAFETAGKILGDYILEKYQNDVKGIMNVLRGIWNKIKHKFANADQKALRATMDEVYGSLAENILKGDIDRFTADNLADHKGIFFQAPKNLDPLAKLLDRIMKRTISKITVIEARGKEGFKEAKLEYAKYNALYADQKYAEGVVEYIKTLNNTLKGLGDDIRAIENNKEISVGVNRKNAATLKTIKSYVDSNMDIIKEIKSEYLEMGWKNKSVEKEIFDELNKASDTLTLAEKKYYLLGLPLYASMLKEYLPGISLDKIISSLKKADKDISMTQRIWDSMSNVHNDALKMMDKMVTTEKELGRQKKLAMKKKLIQAQIDWEKAGGTNVNKFAEIDDKGNLTGNYLSETNRGEYERRSKEAVKKLASNSLFQWYVDNQEISGDEYQEYLKELKELKEDELSYEAYNLWIQNNIYESKKGVEYLKGDYTVPNKKVYKNDVYENLTANDKTFLNTIMEANAELNKLLPIKHQSIYRMPQLRKDFIERLKATSSLKEAGKLTREEVKDTFVRREGDEERFGTQVVTDDSGNIVNFLPVYYTSKLSNPNDLSTDIVESLSRFGDMAYEYKALDNIMDSLELGKDLFADMEIDMVDPSGNPLKSITNWAGITKSEIQTVKGIETLAYKRLEDFFTMQVYGHYQKDEGNIKGTKMDKSKTLGFLGFYTAVSNLALNLYAGIQNPIMGSAQIFTEAFSKEYFTMKDMTWAAKEYWKAMPSLMADMGKRNPTNRLSLWAEAVDALSDFKQETRELNMKRKTIFGRLFNTSALFFINHAGEHLMQVTTSIAMAKNVKLKDSKGNDYNLYTAMEKVGNELKVKDGMLNMDGTPFTNKDFANFIIKSKDVNQGLHGIYDVADANAWQQYALGRLALMFRKFAKAGWNRRWAESHYNFRTDREIEGYYTSTVNFMRILRSDLRAGQFSLQKGWDKLSDHQKRNNIKTLADIVFIFSSVLLAKLLTGFAEDDDEDKWALNMTAYQANRLYSELMFYTNPKEGFRILKSPAAAIDQVENVITFITGVTNWGEELESGPYKGWTRFEKGAFQTVPLGRTIKKWSSPEESLTFFTGNF